VLALMAEGRSNSAIAGILVVSERGVENHVGNIFSKLGLALLHDLE
jgi:DNA-binding NarL/FixJ family response regulator